MGQYSSLFEEEKQAPNPAIAVQLTADAVPQNEARYKDLAARYKVPVDLVRTLPKDYEEKAKVDDIDRLTAPHPHLRSWLADTKNTPLVDVPDVSNLSAIGSALTTGFKYAVGAPGVERSLLKDAGNTAMTLGVGAAVGLPKAVVETAATLNDLIGFTSGATKMRQDAKALGQVMADLAPEATTLTGKATVAGLQSAGTNLALLPIGMWRAATAGVSSAANLVAGAMGTATGAEAFNSIREKGGNILEALRYGIPHGAFEYVFEKIPATKLFTDIGASASLHKILAGQMLTEGAAEQATTLFQDFNTWMNVNPDKTLGQFIKERPEAAYQTLVATAVGVATQTGALHSINKAVGGHQREQQQQQNAEQSVQHLGQLMALASQSKLRERSPQTFTEISQEMADKTEGAPSEVRFDARKLSEVLNQEELAMLPSVASQMQEALATGGEVSVPIGELMANVGGTSLEQKLTEHARVGDNELSSFEAKEASAQAESYLQTEAQRVIAAASDNVGAQTSADNVKKTLIEQFTALKRFSPDVNSAYATVASNMYTALASRLGVTSEQAYAAHPLTLDGVNPATKDVLNTVDQKPKVTYKAGKAPDENILYVGRKRVGSTLVWKDGNQLKLESLYVDPKQRSAGVGSAALDAQLEIARGQSRGMESVASDVTNRRILDMLVRRLGQPEYVSDVYKEMTLDQARERLPAEPHPTSEDITGDAIFLRWPVSALETAKGYSQEQIPQTETKAFKEWFGDSKVVDAEGKPLVVYHGAPTTMGAQNKMRPGRFFTSNPAVAERFGKVLHPVYLSMANPLVVDANSEAYDNLPNNEDTDLLAERAKKEGYDGVIVRNVVEGNGNTHVADTYITFADTHIKSAIGNDGSFDPNDANILRQGGIGDNGRSFTGFFSNITKGLTGKPNSNVHNSVFDVSGAKEFATEYSKSLGAFDDHIASSIPGFREVQTVVGDAIVKSYPDGANVLDIGASEANFGRSIAQVSGTIHTTSLDPNFSMADFFAKHNTSPNAEYVTAAFGTKTDEGNTAWVEDATLVDRDGFARPNPYAGQEVKFFTPDKKYDVVHEAMVFQFFSGDRDMQVSRAKEMMNAAGVLILEEKFVAGEGLTDKQFRTNEAQKDAYKEQFFTKSQIAAKAKAVGVAEKDERAAVGMNDLMSTPGGLEAVLRSKFANVTQFWDSGNFKGYIASDDSAALNTLLGNMQPTMSAFSTVETPRVVQDAQEQTEQRKMRQETDLAVLQPSEGAGEKPVAAPANKLDDPAEYAKALKGFVEYYGDAERAAENLDSYKDAVSYLAENGGTVYRVLFANSPAEIDKNNFGEHWSVDRSLAEDRLDHFGSHFGKGEKAYLIEATVPPNAVNNRGVDVAGNPEEQEVNLSATEGATYRIFERQDGRFVAVPQTPEVLQPSEGAGEKPASQTETKAFKNWFGDSKVVDAEGEPLVVYHGGREFDAFDATAPSRMTQKHSGYFWLTSSKANAEFYQDGEVKSLYVKMDNPAVVEGDDPAYAGMNPRSIADTFLIQNFEEDTSWDGVIIRGVVDGALPSDVYVVFPDEKGSTTQLKSAIGNNGEFSTNDANILRQSTAAPGSLNLTGVHFSKESRTTLDGRFYGSGLKGAERDRALNAQDKRLAERLYFYIDEGKGVRSESGVGGVAHESEIKNVYDLRADPLKLNAVGNLSQTESNILDAGFNGYYVSDAFNGQGVAVLLGQASRGVASSRISNPNQALPTPQPVQPYKRGLSSKELNSVNLEEVQKVAPSAQILAGTFQVAQAELAAAQQAMADQGISLPNANTFSSSNARGTFNPSTLTISLLEGADLSTFHHEMAHFYLEVLADIAGQPNAPAAITSDMEVLLKWFKVKDLATWNAMTLAQKRDNHEKFAEHYEAYLFEGKAPNMEVQALFQRFASWMKSVYKSLSAFAASHNTALTSEVRAVYDRMLATDTQIEEAEAARRYMPLFKSAEQASMTPEAWAQYQTLGADATETALEGLRARSLRDLKWTVNARAKALKAATKDVAAKRKTVEAEVRAEVEALPVYVAKAALGKKPSDADLMVAAEQFGFSSPDEMLRSIAEASPIKHVIDGMTDQRLLERYGDLTTAQGIENAANEAVHNEARAKFIAAELAAISKANKPTNVILKAAKQFAEGLVASREIRDLAPSKHSAAETRAAKAAEKAMATGDTQAAIVAKRDQILQFYSAKITTEAKDEVERKVKALKKIEASASLPIEYKDQIDKLLERVELREQTLTTIDSRAQLAEWVKSQEDIGVEPSIPANLLEGMRLTNYKSMTVEDFRGLYDTIKQIEHLGRLKNKLLTAKDDREFALVKSDIVAGVLKFSGNRKADTRTPTTLRGEQLQKVKNFFSAHIKAATIARELDGGKDGGKVWEYFISPANEKSAWETSRRAEATESLTAIMAPWLAKKDFNKKVFYPLVGKSFTRQEVFAMALNTGNESNLQRLLGGEGWTETQLEPMLKSLDATDWTAAQKVWDYMEAFWPEIEAKHLRVYGARLEKVPTGTALASQFGVTGGYYPVKFDPAASVRAEEHADAEGASRQLKGAYGAATTRRSFTKTRVDEVHGRPLLYNLSGLYAGVNDVIHDLAWHEWLIDVNRLLKSSSIDSAIRNTYGPAYLRQLKTWRDAIAAGDSGSQEALDGALGWLRQSVSMAGLGFNVMSAALQPLGASLSIDRIGLKWFGHGAANYISNPVRATREAQAMSAFMRNRGRTQFRDLNELSNKVKGEGGVLDSVRKNSFWLMMRAQQMVDVPTWHGAYEKAVSEGNNEERSVRLADQAVIDSQGGGELKDLAAIERGGAAQKLFTVFYSFMNTAFNAGYQSARTGSTGKKAASLLLVGVMPAILASLLRDALTPGDSGEDDWKKLAKKLGGEQLSYLMGLMVVTRELGEAGKTMTGLSEHARDYSGPAGVRMLADINVMAKQINQGEFDDSFRKAAVNLVGDFTGLPSAQINRTITGANALREGKTSNPAAAVFGYQEPK